MICVYSPRTYLHASLSLANHKHFPVLFYFIFQRLQAINSLPHGFLPSIVSRGVVNFIEPPFYYPGPKQRYIKM